MNIISIGIVGFMILFIGILIIPQNENDFHTYLDRSIPFIGNEISQSEGIFGKDIKIAVIDTGVDFNHPDLFGWGPEGKVIGGYNFINPNEPPVDTNGHGTLVAGIVAADGNVKGVAPKAKILAYKVSDDGEGVASDLIIKAIQKAVEDDADIINISLGVNKTNTLIDNAVRDAINSGVIVVTAAGNDGPKSESIGSPGKSFSAITVGATYNDLSSSLVATLEIGEEQYTVIPMTGNKKLEKPISGKIIFGGYGKENELEKIDVNDSILIVERGSDIEGELLYFSTKETNAANAGARGLIVFNNIDGVFFGELIHEFIDEGYSPRIPVVSIDRDDGLKIINSQLNEDASLHLFFNPDFLAHFSSRGPVSPFYIKPNLVAPGAYINSTHINGGYNFTSGTSFAAPHVSGAIALMKEKYPELTNNQIESIILTSVEPVRDAYGNEFSVDEVGSGRLNVNKALDANLIFTPPSFILNFSNEKLEINKVIEITTIKKNYEKLNIEFIGPKFIKFSSQLDGENLVLTFSSEENNFGEYDGRILINDEKSKYTIPFLIHFTSSTVDVKQENDKLIFEIIEPSDWSFAKMTITNQNSGKTETVTATPDKTIIYDLMENGEYFVESKIRFNENSTTTFNVIKVNGISEKKSEFDIISREIILILLGISIIGIVGIVKRN